MTLGNVGGLPVPRLAAPSPLVAALLTASPTRGEASRTPNNVLAKGCSLERQDTPRREASRTPDQTHRSVIRSRDTTPWRGGATVVEREELVALVDRPEAFLGSDDAVLRRMAITALDSAVANRMFDTLAVLLHDGDASVRAAAAAKLGACGERASVHLASVENDDEPKVREVVATAYGELADSTAIPWLVEAGSTDQDRTVKEAAVAALGAIEDDRAIDPLLGFIAKGPPQVRRRAIAAITVFDDARIEPAIRRAAFDRNPGVREAAEMVVGKQLADDN
jgi:HEAT repeat protein